MPSGVLLKVAVLEQPVGWCFLGPAAGQQLAVVSTCHLYQQVAVNITSTSSYLYVQLDVTACIFPTARLPTAAHSVLDML
jgi:hypothetical protein